MLLIRTCFLILALTCNSSFAQLIGPSDNQQNEPLKWLEVPQHPEQFYLTQQTQTGALTLTANESFFPKLGLVAQGGTPSQRPSAHLNQDKDFKSIGKWDTGDQAEWGVFFRKTGKLDMVIQMTAVSAGRCYSVTLANQTHTFTVPPTKDKKAKAIHWQATIKKAGRYSLILQCEKDRAKNKTKLNFIELSGEAVANSYVLRERWRPKAAHTKFTSSHSPKGVCLWIVEMDAAPGSLDFYAPLTTPFGYFGPTWLADGRVNVGLNFSLWSFRRGAEEPPIQKLSRLLAIGNSEASFGGFDHEGTGVKVRDWEPLAGRQAQKQVLALRVLRGNPCDTYYSYFFDSAKREWCFFASGKVLKAKRKRNLYPGSFVEVPGRAHVQRTGAYVRRMRYRSWVLDGEGVLHFLDRMSVGDVNKKTKLTHTDRGQSDDGRLFLQTGGWTFRKKLDGKQIKVATTPENSKADFLGVADIEFLKTVPCAIEATKAKRKGKSVKIEFNVRNRGKKAKAFVYWGEKEGLTFAKKWSKSIQIPKPKEGENTWVLKTPKSKKKIYFRMFLQNSDGQFWSTETATVD